MKRRHIILVAMAIACLATQAQDWRRHMSRVEEHVVKSEVLGAERNYTVYLPAGVYAVSGKIQIPPYVTLRGDWQDPDTGGDGCGTVIFVLPSPPW